MTNECSLDSGHVCLAATSKEFFNSIFLPQWDLTSPSSSYLPYFSKLLLICLCRQKRVMDFPLLTSFSCTPYCTLLLYSRWKEKGSERVVIMSTLVIPAITCHVIFFLDARTLNTRYFWVLILCTTIMFLLQFNWCGACVREQRVFNLNCAQVSWEFLFGKSANKHPQKCSRSYVCSLYSHPSPSSSLRPTPPIGSLFPLFWLTAR